MELKHCFSQCQFDENEFPKFDSEAARNLGADEVRKRWPRKMLRCLKCGIPTICYASFEHYICGDW